MSHTPTPWRVTEDKFGIEAELRPGEWRDIAMTHSTNVAGHKFDNAVFIVRACNAHDELVAALSAANRVLFLLESEVRALGCGSAAVLGRVTTALAKVQA